MAAEDEDPHVQIQVPVPVPVLRFPASAQDDSDSGRLQLPTHAPSPLNTAVTCLSTKRTHFNSKLHDATGIAEHIRRVGKENISRSPRALTVLDY